MGLRPKIRLGFEVRALHFDEIKKQHTLIKANHKYPWHVWETEACWRPVRSEAGRTPGEGSNIISMHIDTKEGERKEWKQIATISVLFRIDMNNLTFPQSKGLMVQIIN